MQNKPNKPFKKNGHVWEVYIVDKMKGLPTTKKARKEDWLTVVIWNLMDQCREFKNKDRKKYLRMNKLIITKVKEAKQAWLNHSC